MVVAWGVFCGSINDTECFEAGGWREGTCVFCAFVPGVVLDSESGASETLDAEHEYCVGRGRKGGRGEAVCEVSTGYIYISRNGKRWLDGASLNHFSQSLRSPSLPPSLLSSLYSLLGRRCSGH